MSENMFKEFSSLALGLQKYLVLAPYTTWKIGGPARYFWEPTRKLLPDVVRFCKSNGIKI